jgi:histidinol dehydrogenase
VRRLEPEDALKLRERREAASTEIVAAVAGLIADVRARGDAAVLDAVRRFQGAEAGAFAVADAEWDRLAAACPDPVRKALETAAARIAAFQGRQLPHGYQVDAAGARLELLVHPLDRVLCYAPGGRASYPSTVLMTAVPARIAGVQRVLVTSPRVTPEVAAAARIAGAHALYRLGGAHAVAAFALGTETLPQVDKIVGPGNAYVTEAKRQLALSGEVGIDLVAGPTEVVIVCDGSADPDIVAVDLIAQAEHDPMALALAVTPVAELAEKILAALAAELRTFPNPVAEEALRARGGVVVVDGLDAALALADDLAPEHLQLSIDDPEAALHRVTHAGAVFLGHHTPVPVGDYIAGPNHTLPTGGTARFASALSPADFVRRQSVLAYTEERMRTDGDAIRALAGAEGLPGHARAVEVREA